MSLSICFFTFSPLSFSPSVSELESEPPLSFSFLSPGIELRASLSDLTDFWYPLDFYDFIFAFLEPSSELSSMLSCSEILPSFLFSPAPWVYLHQIYHFTQFSDPQLQN